MSVDDYCRLCKEYLRINGSLTNTKRIFEETKIPNDKNVYERLIDLGLTLSKDRSRSCRICRSCLRLLARMEDNFATFKRWQESERQPNPPPAPPVPAAGAAGAQSEAAPCIKQEEQEVELGHGQAAPAETPVPVKRACPEPGPEPEPEPATAARIPTSTRLWKPGVEMPARRSQTEVIIRYPSHPKGDRVVCKADTAGMVESIAKKNWKRAANLIVRHNDLFGRLKENILQVIEDECKILCSPYKGFMLWQSSASDLRAFSFANLLSDLECMSPFLFSILCQITQQSPLPICAAASIALRGREPRLSAFAYYVDRVLQNGGAKKTVFTRLSKLGITTSHTSALVKQKEFANTEGEDYLLLKADEIFLNSLEEDEYADFPELGSPEGTEDAGMNTDEEEEPGTSTQCDSASYSCKTEASICVTI